MPSNKTRFILKIVLFTSAVLAAGIALYLAICMFSNINNEFTLHFGMPLVLVLISVIAFTLPILTKKKYQEDSKDKIMFIVGVLLILLAILTLIMSYFNIFG